MKYNIVDAIKKLSIHDHICLIYNNQHEKLDIIIPFINIGLDNNEKCIYIADDDNTKEDILREFRNNGIEIDNAIKNGKFVITSKNETYLKHGFFDPDEAIRFLKESTDSAKKEGFSALRIVGEMTWIGNDQDIQQAMEYESKLNNVLSEIDCTAICEYDINLLRPEIIMEVINTHPLVIFEYLICENFYYIPPDKFLESKEIANTVKLFLENMKKMELAKKMLEDSENKYRTIVETSYEGIWIIDASAKTTFVNSHMAQLLGYTPEEMIGKEIYYFIDKDLRVNAEKNIEYRKPGIKDIHDFKLTRIDGTYLWVILSSSPLFDHKGQYIGALAMVTDITERKQIESKLRKSEENLRRAQRVAHIGNWEWDIITGKITWSEETFHIHGIDPKEQEPTYDELVKYFHPEDIPNFEHVVEDAVKNGIPYTIVFRTIFQDGNTHYIEARGEAIRDNNGKIFKLFGTSMDVTERVHIQSLLNETQKITKVGGWEYDVEKKTMTWTDELYEIYGVSKEYNPSNIDNDIEFFSSEDRKIFMNAFYDAINHGTQYDLELKFNSIKGERLWIRTIARPVFQKGKVVKIMGIFKDITGQKNIEQSLRLHTEIIKNMSEGVYLARLYDLKIVYTNPKFEQMFGYETGEMIGRDVAIVNAPTEKNPEETTNEIIEILNKKGEWYGEMKNIKKDGTHFWCYASCSLFDHIEYGKVIVAVHTNITKRKIAEEKLNKTYKDLERSNTELEQFAYVASHDLQEPLRTIYGYTELLESNYKGKLDTDADDFIEYITTGARRMQQMINDLLALSRITTRGEKFSPINIERILKIVIQNLHSLIDENHAIITHDSIPTIIADDSQITQLFQNLIDNAIKFRREETPKIHISCKRINREWVFSVTDNGIGIDKNQFKKLFIIFQRLHSREEYPGTGIGLAMCKKIVERHGGKIWLESEIGIGSIFYFTIPVRPANSGTIDQVQI